MTAADGYMRAFGDEFHSFGKRTDLFPEPAIPRFNGLPEGFVGGEHRDFSFRRT
jgi:hypothetical protein